MFNLKYKLKYFFSKIKLTGKKFDLKILDNEETLNLILEKKSIIRFGDGEFSLIGGKSNLFENYSQDIKKALLECLTSTQNSNILICIPEPLVRLSKFTKKAKGNFNACYSDRSSCQQMGLSFRKIQRCPDFNYRPRWKLYHQRKVF